MNDPFNLQRFVAAQDSVYGSVVAELQAGRKESHWMWFVFPQIQGLGYSGMAVKYAIASAAEARAYLEHPVLGPRLRECVKLVLAIEDASAWDIFGSPDDLKFRSSLTLFAEAATDHQLFRAALEKYFESEPDSLTLQLLGTRNR